MWNGTKRMHIGLPLGKIIDSKMKAQNKFRPSREPIFAITASTYKGLSFYLFCDQVKKLEVVFNTSSIDAAYVEFTRIIGSESTKTMVYTQHALDRYNERVHGKKYDNYKDMMKRLIVNNPMLHSEIIDDKHKIVMKIKEGFLSGTANAVHRVLTINTFFDKVEFEDNKMQQKARLHFDALKTLTPAQHKVIIELREQYKEGQITLELLVEQLTIHGMPSNDEIKEINMKAEQRAGK